MTWKKITKKQNNRATLLGYIKLCAVFQSHQWIQTGITIWKRLIQVKMALFCSVWPWNLMDDIWKTIRHLFYVASNCVHHFIANIKFNLELQSRNAKFVWKSAFYLSRMTLKFDGGPWKTIRHLFRVISIFVHQFVAICEFKLESRSGNNPVGSKSLILFVPCDLEIWWMTLKKQEGTSSMLHQALCIISSTNLNSNWSYSPETEQLGFDLDFCTGITSVNGNNSWNFHDDSVRGT